MPGSALDRLAADAFLDNLWDLTARALLDARYQDAAALVGEAEEWLRNNGSRVLDGDDLRVWTQRFARSRKKELAEQFDDSSDVPAPERYRETSFAADPVSSEIVVHEVACTRERTRLTWSRAETSAEQALADAHTALEDDLGTAYLSLDSGGGATGAEGRYVGYSRFAPAIPREAAELKFRTGHDTAPTLKRREKDPG